MTRPRHRLWAWPGELRRRGILGVNRRNAELVLCENPRARFPTVDDKLHTKRLCEARGIRVPETFAVISRHGEVRKFPALLAHRGEFVIKPASGAEGRGILVVTRLNGTDCVTAGGQRLTVGELRYHLSTLLSGLFSLAGQPDRAIVEERIRPHPMFDHVAVGGTPDIRIILYRNVPVMAMVRLPTRASRGRANLHQGAVAAGVDLRTGRTFGGVWKSRLTSVHPDTGVSIEGFEIPGWETLLASATNLAQALKLGYLGIDFVLDAEAGPVVLEANARPGLAIQLANRCGLLPRLKPAQSPPPNARRRQGGAYPAERPAEIV